MRVKIHAGDQTALCDSCIVMTDVYCDVYCDVCGGVAVGSWEARGDVHEREGFRPSSVNVFSNHGVFWFFRPDDAHTHSSTRHVNPSPPAPASAEAGAHTPQPSTTHNTSHVVRHDKAVDSHSC